MFPIEPHFMAPFIHYLPRWLQRRTVRWFTPWGWSTKPTSQQVENMLNEIRLLTYCEMVDLFPDCEIRREKWLGLTKSYIAVRISDDSENKNAAQPKPDRVLKSFRS